jgi:GAF domain-containing protein
LITSITELCLSAALALALFLTVLNYQFWRFEPHELSALWLSGWVAAGAVYAFCRLLQFAQLSDAVYALLPRLTLTSVFASTWIGFELASAFTRTQPPRWVRVPFLLLVAAPIVLAWTSELVLTDRVIQELTGLGEAFHGVAEGPLLLPSAMLILALGALQSIRLVITPGSGRAGNLVMAAGFAVGILFTLLDFVGASRGWGWIRLSDFGFLPIGFLFSWIQVRRVGRLYRALDVRVRERTAELRRANERLRAEVVERKQAEKVARRRASELAMVHEATRDLVMEHDPSRLLQTIVQHATELLDGSGGAMYLCEPERRQVRCVVSHQTPRDYRGMTLKYGQDAAGTVADTGEPLVIDDYRSWPGRVEQDEQDSPVLSLLTVPMVWLDGVIGVITVQESRRERRFGLQDVVLLTLFANQAAATVQNALLFEAEQAGRRRALALADVGRKISESLDLDVVLERIARYAKELLEAETTAVYLAEPGSSTLHAIAALGPDSDQIKQDPVRTDRGILGGIARSGRGEIVNDSAADPRGVTIAGTRTEPFEHLMAVPVRLGEVLRGLLAVWRLGEGKEFKAADLEYLDTLAGQVAVAIENARLFEAERRRRQEADALRQAAGKITAALDQDEAIQTILEQLARVVPYESASLQLLREGFLEVVGGQGWNDPGAVLGTHYPIPGENPYTPVVQERRAVILTDAREAYAMFKESPNDGTRSWLGVPLMIRERVIGVLAVEHGWPGFFTNAHADLVGAFASQAAIAIENARLFEATRRRLVEIDATHKLSVALRTAQTLGQALPIILDQLTSLLNARSASLEVVDPATGEIVTVRANGDWQAVTGLRAPAGTGVSGRVVLTGQPYVSADVVSDGLTVRPDLFGPSRAVACVPVIAQGQRIGVLWIGREAPVREEEVRLLSAMGEMVGTTVDRLRLHDRTDSLLEDLQRSHGELSQAYDATIAGWSRALDLRDQETEGHTQRVLGMTLRMGRAFGMSEEDLVHVRRGALLHDIGKMGVSDRLLRKTGPLTEEEWVEMRLHPQHARDLLEPIEYLRPALDIPYCHHERWDGSGYPRGLKGEEIPLSARIFAIVDCYDAVSHDRIYRAAWPRTKVLNHLRRQAGVEFDPKVVDMFFTLLLDGKLPTEGS